MSVPCRQGKWSLDYDLPGTCFFPLNPFHLLILYMNVVDQMFQEAVEFVLEVVQGLHV